MTPLEEMLTSGNSTSQIIYKLYFQKMRARYNAKYEYDEFAETF